MPLHQLAVGGVSFSRPSLTLQLIFPVTDSEVLVFQQWCKTSKAASFKFYSMVFFYSCAETQLEALSESLVNFNVINDNA